MFLKYKRKPNVNVNFILIHIHEQSVQWPALVYPFDRTFSILISIRYYINPLIYTSLFLFLSFVLSRGVEKSDNSVLCILQISFITLT